MSTPERRSAVVQRRWEPMQELDQMRRFLEETFGGVPASIVDSIKTWVPPVDIEETDDAYVVEAELPGVKRGDVDIELVGNELTISGEMKEKERKGILRKQTRRVGRFEFHVTLPDQVDGNGIDASLDSGVLTVRVPKSQRAERRKIEVK
jgi:HSP20 family protein